MKIRSREAKMAPRINEWPQGTSVLVALDLQTESRHILITMAAFE